MKTLNVKFYTAKVNESRNCWGHEFELNDVITVDYAKQIIEMGNKAVVKEIGKTWQFEVVEVENGNKKIIYNAKTNILTVWQNEHPIYQNNNGVICRDCGALADGLM